MRKVLLTAVAAAALGGCHKPAANTVADASDSRAETVSTSDAQPHRKAGLWEQRIIRDGKPLPMGAMRACVDPASDAKASVFGEKLGQGPCKSHSISRGPDGAFHFSSVCEGPMAGTVTTRGVAAGDFASGYKVHSESDVDGSALPGLNGHHVMDMEVRYLGECPAGMAPGQLMLGNGMKVNAGKITGAAVALGTQD
jgi:hypothetical protein